MSDKKLKAVFDTQEIKVRGMSGREFYVTIHDGFGFCADGNAWRDLNWPEPLIDTGTAAQVWQIE